MKKVICIKNVDVYYDTIKDESALHIGKFYTIQSISKTSRYVYLYENGFKIGVYFKFNFKLIENFRQERVNKLIK